MCFYQETAMTVIMTCNVSGVLRIYNSCVSLTLHTGYILQPWRNNVARVQRGDSTSYHPTPER